MVTLSTLFVILFTYAIHVLSCSSHCSHHPMTTAAGCSVVDNVQHFLPFLSFVTVVDNVTWLSTLLFITQRTPEHQNHAGKTKARLVLGKQSDHRTPVNTSRSTEEHYWIKQLLRDKSSVATKILGKKIPMINSGEKCAIRSPGPE
jgi:hypothetical protein